MGRHFHLHHARVMLPVASVCLVPVVIRGKDLALLLFSGVYHQWEGGVDANVELGKVII
jgi:hypothetical protein